MTSNRLPSTELTTLTESQYNDAFFESYEGRPNSESFPVILIHLGEELPLHIYDCFDQLHEMGVGTIHFIVNSVNAYQRLTYCSGVIPYMYHAENHLRQSLNAAHTNENIFQLSLERFFALLWFLRKYNIDTCLHMEHDNLLYIPIKCLEEVLQKQVQQKLAAPRDTDNRLIASVFYVGSRAALERYCDFVAQEENFQYIDMQSLSNFELKYPEYCRHLPVTPVGFPTAPNFSDSQIPFLFDAAALGQWVGGVDIIHTTYGLDSRGFINPDALKYYLAHDLPVVWVLTKSGKKVPLVERLDSRSPAGERQGTYFRLCNLHIHAKKLHLYLSATSMSKSDIIQGNKFKDLAQVQLHTRDDILAYFSHPQSNFKVIVIYVKTDFIHEFFHLAPSLGKFLLITHNSDYCITEDHIRYLDQPNVIMWWAQNCQIQHPKLVPIPIGIANSEFEHGNLETLVKIMSRKVAKRNALYVNLSDTHPVRKQILDYYHSHPEPRVVIEKDRLNYEDYLSKMQSFSWNAAPRGNGPDTHRLWELYYLDSLPVTYDALFQTIPCIPSHYLPFVDLATFEPTPQDIPYAIQMKGLGRIYSRMSYWRHFMATMQRCAPSVDVVIISDLSSPQLHNCINSVKKYVACLNRIYLVRSASDVASRDKSQRDNNGSSEHNVHTIVADTTNLPAFLCQNGFLKKVLLVDPRLCFTSYVYFQNGEQQDLFTCFASDHDHRQFQVLTNLPISEKLSVEGTFHGLYDLDIVKEIQPLFTKSTVPWTVFYFHYLAANHPQRLKLRNLFFLTTRDESEYHAALESHYYRFVVKLE